MNARWKDAFLRPVDLGTKHVVVCARTMCKQCFPESKRVVQLDNERSVMLYPPSSFVRRREGTKWNGLCGSRNRSSMSKSYFSTEMRLRVAGWVSSPRKTGRILGTRVRTPNLQDFSPFSCYKFLLRLPRDAGLTFTLSSKIPKSNSALRDFERFSQKVINKQQYR